MAKLCYNLFSFFFVHISYGHHYIMAANFNALYSIQKKILMEYYNHRKHYSGSIISQEITFIHQQERGLLSGSKSFSASNIKASIAYLWKPGRGD